MIKNIIFIHVCKINNYQKIFDEIYNSIIESELIDDIEKIKLSLLGNNELNISKNNKIEIIYNSNNIEEYEFPTLNLIKDFCFKNKDYNILYLHTKGVTGNNICIDDWRKYMLYFNVFKYKKCLDKLKKYDTCGVDLVNEPVTHYSGNFWWSTSDHINNLQNINDMKTILTNRHKCEFWICSNEKGKYFSLWNSDINVYERHLHRYEEKNYIKENERH